MRKSILSVLAAGFLCLASCTPPENEVNPDLQGEADVMFVGNIITMDQESPRAKAMTVNVAWQLKEENLWTSSMPRLKMLRTPKWSQPMLTV